MNLKFSYFPEARRELYEALRFYRDADKSVADRFLRECSSAIKQIMRDPLASVVISGNTRRKILDKFPFSIIYRFESNEIRIVALCHHRREPGYWRNRD